MSKVSVVLVRVRFLARAFAQAFQDFWRPERIGEELRRDLRVLTALALSQKSPVLVLPEDEMRRKQLWVKLAEYISRMKPYAAPESQMDTICKITVLGELMRYGRVDTWEISREMAQSYGRGFDAMMFQNACAVVADYCKTGGRNLRGGTGLPALLQGCAN